MESIGNYVWVIFLLMALQPMIQKFLITRKRQSQIRKIQAKTNTRVITMIHRQESGNIIGFRVNRHIDIEDAQTIIGAIERTPANQPIDLIMHTPGGMVLAAMQIARAVKAHSGKVTVHVPFMAMSGGTLIALAADEIVMGDFSVLGPIDPQIAGFPAASIVAAKQEKPIEHVSDLTLVFADLGGKAIAQIEAGAVELLADRVGEDDAKRIARELATGQWTHDYAVTPQYAEQLGLPVKIGLLPEVVELMTLFPQPTRMVPSVEYIPIDRRAQGDTSVTANVGGSLA